MARGKKRPGGSRGKYMAGPGDAKQAEVVLRKNVLRVAPPPPVPPDEIDVAGAAVVTVTSEAPGHPVENAFDRRRGPGGSRWVAGEPGEQALVLAFDAPRPLRQVVLEVEEREVERRQQVE